VHGGAGIFRGNEKVLRARFVFLGKKGVAGLMDMQNSRDEVSLGWA